MFSFQPHNQVLYHLSQLTSVINPKSMLCSIKIKKQNGLKKPVDSTSYSYLSEVTKTYADILIDKLCMFNTITMLNIKTNNVLLMLDQLSMKIFEKNVQKNNKWKVSYVPELNFIENKQKYLYKQCAEEVILPSIYLSPKNHHRTLYTFCVKNPFNYHIQTRGFRTKYNVKPGLKKESSFTNKFKKFIGYFSETNTGIVKVLKEKDMAAIKNLLNNQTLVEEQKKMIMAFIDGYETGVKYRTRYQNRNLKWLKVITSVMTISILALLWYGAYLVGSNLRFSFDNLKIRPEITNLTFDDIKGVDEAKQELQDLVEFLKNPEKFYAIGAKLPKGVLLVGPPGTGKTLLARAVAGEANVPFFHVAGPEFEEVLVGQGARRMRELFKVAKENAPAVIFIDEIDSVGSKRTFSSLHPYANQTVNQLLTEMDGFLKNEGIIVVGATNRRDDLDQALLRPGRFDVEVYVSMPDCSSRKEIFDLYLSRILTQNIDTEYLARKTYGFTGADIENMVNQAALKAVINEDDRVTMKHLEYAQDKILLGPARKKKIKDEDVNSITAYHEAGHTLVAYYTKDAMAIHKVTIVSHRFSLGHTAFIPCKDDYYVTKSALLAQMDTAMGGRAAEEFIFGADKVTTGSEADFKTATTIAENMVKIYGMSEKVGLGQYIGNRRKQYQLGPAKSDVIDIEVKRLLEESYERARHVLQQHAKELKNIAEALMKYETLSYKEIQSIISGQTHPN